MKKLLLAIIAAFAISNSFAQNTAWPSPTGTSNVGIGTTSPTAKLSVSGSGTVSNTGAPSILDVFGNFDGLFGRARLTLGNSANTVGGSRSTSILMYGMNASGNAYENKWELGADHDSNGSNDFYFYNAVANTFPLYMSASSNVGVGTITPSTKLDVNGQGSFIQNIFVKSNNTSSTEALLYKQNGGYYDIVSNNSGFQIYNSTSSNVIINADNSDNIGIGTTDTKGYKLAIAGNAIAESVTVKLQANWPDYVFKPTYNLASLKDVKIYIDQNHHLPDMPSEQQVMQNGINLGEMVKLQTKKIEELTLYLIQQKEELQQQKTTTQHQQNQIKELKNQIETLRNSYRKKR